MMCSRLTKSLIPLALAFCSAACGAPEDDLVEPYESEPPVPGDWLRPTSTDTWQWQIEGALNSGYDVGVYDIDLFENDAAAIAALHDAGRRVVCYFSAGTYEEWRDDASEYPESIVGQPLEDWPDERWVDIRSKSLRAILEQRLDFAAEQGCDGVEPDNVTAYHNDSGFDLTAEDQLGFNRWLADQAHARNLAVGLKNDGDQAAELEPWFDFSVNEECHFYEECEELAPFLAAGKPIFNAEYAESAEAASVLATSLCPTALAAGTRTLILPLDLDDTFRVSCDAL